MHKRFRLDVLQTISELVSGPQPSTARCIPIGDVLLSPEIPAWNPRVPPLVASGEWSRAECRNAAVSESQLTLSLMSSFAGVTCSSAPAAHLCARLHRPGAPLAEACVSDHVCPEQQYRESL
jgi:hypothetical protein